MSPWLTPVPYLSVRYEAQTSLENKCISQNVKLFLWGSYIILCMLDKFPSWIEMAPDFKTLICHPSPNKCANSVHIHNHWGEARSPTPYQFYYMWTRGSQHAAGWSEGGCEGNNSSWIDAGGEVLVVKLTASEKSKECCQTESEWWVESPRFIPIVCKHSITDTGTQ